MIAPSTTSAAFMLAIASAMTVSAVPTVQFSERATGVSPTAPGPGDVFRAGSTCTTEWTPDTSGTWKNFTIDLMTGSNFKMTKLATVATGLDGTDSSKTSISFTCPEVSPYSAIYFYQYSLGGSGSPAWTTRWTIADANGQSTTPTHATQTDGQAIPWGTGKLVGTVQTQYGSGSSTSSNSTSASSSSTASSDAASSTSTSDTTSSSAAADMTSSSSSSEPASSTSSASSDEPTSSVSQQAAVSGSSRASSSSTSGSAASHAVATSVAAFAAIGAVTLLLL
ncbi:unnamed protein product [Jaminaea pallidilutea]